MKRSLHLAGTFIIIFFIALAISVFGTGTPQPANALTTGQIDSVINLLVAFDVDEDTIANVRDALNVGGEEEQTSEEEGEGEKSEEVSPADTGEVVVFEESFEQNMSQWIEDSQDDWFLSDLRAKEGFLSAEFDGVAADATITSLPIDLSGKTNASVVYHWHLDSPFDEPDYIAFDVSTDGGTTWTEKDRLHGNTVDEKVWHERSVVLEDIETLSIRFRGTASDGSEDANVDAVQVIAY